MNTDNLTPIQLRRLEKAKVFISHFEPALKAAVVEYPLEYGRMPVEKVPGVAEKMLEALVRGSYHHEGRAMKASCKALGIEYKRRAIEAFLNQ